MRAFLFLESSCGVPFALDLAFFRSNLGACCQTLYVRTGSNLWYKPASWPELEWLGGVKFPMGHRIPLLAACAL